MNPGLVDWRNGQVLAGERSAAAGVSALVLLLATKPHGQEKRHRHSPGSRISAVGRVLLPAIRDARKVAGTLGSNAPDA
jgi:hypothetical protein